MSTHYPEFYLQVSPTYAREVAGNPVISPHLYKFHGILNGIDPDIWDPFNDKFLPVSSFQSQIYVYLSCCIFGEPIKYESSCALHVPFVLQY